ncbi:MAG: hypothetical protein FWB85_05480 [Chitinispirillia bacterium]|nr:hypothetical protein [Chitinispirillia bacterium]MCL2241676.1 hypothetical protein [Chitinispirillia bacterium]
MQLSEDVYNVEAVDSLIQDLDGKSENKWTRFEIAQGSGWRYIGRLPWNSGAPYTSNFNGIINLTAKSNSTAQSIAISLYITIPNVPSSSTPNWKFGWTGVVDGTPTFGYTRDTSNRYFYLWISRDGTSSGGTVYPITGEVHPFSQGIFEPAGTHTTPSAPTGTVTAIEQIGGTQAGGSGTVMSVAGANGIEITGTATTTPTVNLANMSRGLLGYTNATGSGRPTTISFGTTDNTVSEGNHTHSNYVTTSGVTSVSGNNGLTGTVESIGNIGLAGVASYTVLGTNATSGTSNIPNTIAAASTASTVLARPASGGLAFSKVTPAMLNSSSGTASSSTFYRGDGAWATATPTFSGLTQYGMMYASSTSAISSTVAPTANTVLFATSATAAPSWRAMTGSTSLRNSLGLGTGSYALPNSVGGAGTYLSSDGTNLSWASVTATIPSTITVARINGSTGAAPLLVYPNSGASNPVLRVFSTDPNGVECSSVLTLVGRDTTLTGTTWDSSIFKMYNERSNTYGSMSMGVLTGTILNDSNTGTFIQSRRGWVAGTTAVSTLQLNPAGGIIQLGDRIRVRPYQSGSDGAPAEGNIIFSYGQYRVALGFYSDGGFGILKSSNNGQTWAMAQGW